MASDRRSRGFERAGTCGTRALGLSAARASELRLAAAWQVAAGEGIARHVSGLRLRGGVLEVEVSDPRWAEAIDDLLPRLAGRVRARDPRCGVRGARVIFPDRRRGPVRAARPESETARPVRIPTEPARDPAEPPSGEAAARIRRAAERCLARAGTAPGTGGG